jgi:capsular polysaccharide biosynthesis protein
MTEDAITTENCSRKWCWKWRLLAGLILGGLAALILFLVVPPRYEATATIQVRLEKPRLMRDDARSLNRDNYFVNTQIALMQNHNVLNKALENPEIARLPTLLHQKDKRTWLARNLRIKSTPWSEIVTISIKTEDADASEKIVNAVVDAYFDVNREMDRRVANEMLRGLTEERRRQQQQAQILQDNIRQLAAESTGAREISAALLEMLLREIALETISLTAMKAQRKAFQERAGSPEESSLDQEIRAQEILVEELTKQYNDQFTKNRVRAEEVLDISLHQAPLDQTHRTLQQIDGRMSAIQSEQRAPAQIAHLTRAVSSAPEHKKRVRIAGIGGVLVFFVTLLFCVAVRRR